MPVPAGGDGGHAPGDPYATVEQVKAYMGLTDSDTVDDEQIASALASVSEEIENICDRHFNQDPSPSTRLFDPLSNGLVLIDDVYTLDGLSLVVDGAAWAADTYRLLPLNGLVRGRPWPYTSLEPLWSSRLYYRSVSSVAVTAYWGWPAVPAPVHEACKIATSETFSLKDARFGVAGFGEFGALRVRENPMVMAKLRPYMRTPIMVA